MDTSSTISYISGSSNEALAGLDAQFNAYRVAVRGGNSDLDDLRHGLKAAMEQFEHEKGGGHPNPKWIVLSMRAEFESLLGNLDESVRLEAASLDEAITAHEIAVSHSNLSEYLRRLERFDEAVAHSEQACNTSEFTNVGFLITWAKAIYYRRHAGDTEHASTIITALEKMCSLTDPTDPLRNHALHDEVFRAMRDLDVVRRIVAQAEDNG